MQETQYVTWKQMQLAEMNRAYDYSDTVTWIASTTPLGVRKSAKLSGIKTNNSSINLNPDYLQVRF